MDVEDLRAFRTAKRLTHLDRLRTAQKNLETARQIDGALQMLLEVGEPATSADVTVLADALDLAVTGLCDRNEAAAARSLAEAKLEVIYECDPNRQIRWRRLGRAPRSLAAVRAARTLAQAIELDGEPDEAISRLMSLHMRLRQSPEIAGDEHAGTRLDSMRVLRSLLSSVKREGSEAARRFGDLARRQGDEIVDELSKSCPAECASYLHRAALERRIRPSAQAEAEAIALFERSLQLRLDTPRDHQSRGMAIGDLMVLSGERETGAQILTATVERFEPILPRHYESARRLLIERNLLWAA